MCVFEGVWGGGGGGGTGVCVCVLGGTKERGRGGAPFR